jgi:hypothetical protein
MGIIKYILGIGGMVLGFLLVWKATWFLYNVGSVPFAEKYLGTFGGSHTFYKLLGILIILICFIWVSGSLDDIIMWFFGPIFQGVK